MKTSGWTQEQSPFHAGEQAIQARLGVREKMEDFGRRVIRDYLPEQHRDFYRSLPFLVLASVDDEGRPWTSLVAGEPGFIQSPDPHSLRVGTPPLAGSPLAEHGAVGSALGVLGMLPDARRRNRATGRITGLGTDHFDIAIDQTFGNCPQYIQGREVAHEAAGSEAAPAVSITEGTELNQRANQLISQADTFFIASAYGDGSDSPATGADASHRGGKAGFVRVEGNTLTFPDFSGNNHFNTLGNIELTGRAGLLFVDFADGDLLYLTGDAVILWDDPAIADFEGAQRFVRITVTHWRCVSGSLPLRFRFLDESPSFDSLGSWEAADRRAEERASLSRHVELEVEQALMESIDVRSIYLRPSGNSETLPYRPGQFLPIRITPDDGSGTLDRVYSLSSADDGERYRLSVKREGQASSYIHDSLQVGDRILARAPAGEFVLDEVSERPVVLLSAGIGITPVLAMAQSLVEAAERGEHRRDVYFVHGARNGRHHAFRSEVQNLAARYAGLRVHFVYSSPDEDDRADGEHHAEGRVDIALLKTLLPLDDYDFYLCGPGPFMDDLHSGLTALRIPAERIHYEAFGPATVSQRARTDDLIDADPVPVRFEDSRVEVQWSPEKGSLLELAESEGIDAPYACRSGNCGSCAVPKAQGSIVYTAKPIASEDNENVLICSAIPAPGHDEMLVLRL